MKKLAVVALVIAVAVMFAIPVMADNCSCPKPCNNTCVKAEPKPCNTCPKPCVTCGQPSNVLQTAADTINSMEAPTLPCPKPCNTCAKQNPCPTCAKQKPCNTCPKPCNTCPKTCNSCAK